MRIAYIINSVEGGGAASPVPAVTGVLRRGGADVRVLALTRRDGRGLPAMERAGLDVRVREGGEADHAAALRWIDAQVSAWQPTHLWTSLTRATLLGQMVGLRRGLPVISWQHAAYLRPWNLRLLRATQRLSRLWVGDSETVTRLTAKRLGIGADRLVRWPIFPADPGARQAAAWSPGEPVRIGSLGRLHPVKGYDVLMAALALLPARGVSWRMVIGGDGAELAALQARAPANVDLAGFAADPAAFLAGLHLYVQPSRSEGLCVAAHEAMQAGLPVVASAVGELPHSITAETGRTVPPNDPAALAAALAEMLAAPDRLHAMGLAARARVLDRFGPEAFEATGFAILDRMRAMTR